MKQRDWYIVLGAGAVLLLLWWVLKKNGNGNGGSIEETREERGNDPAIDARNFSVHGIGRQRDVLI